MLNLRFPGGSCLHLHSFSPVLSERSQPPLRLARRMNRFRSAPCPDLGRNPHIGKEIRNALRSALRMQILAHLNLEHCSRVR